VRCHSLEGQGGSAGPKLDGVGTRGDRNYLLQSLIAPSAKIVEGYATVVLHLHSGDLVAGVVVKDQDGAVEIMDVDGKTTTVPWDRIARRSGSTTSAMPPMGPVLKPRELRDLVEFLSRLK
jgi:putative heme-binding domain-containing protein